MINEFRPSEVQSYLGDVSKFPDECHLGGDQAYKEIIISFTLLQKYLLKERSHY